MANESTRHYDLHFGSRNGGYHHKPAPGSREDRFEPEDPHSSDHDDHSNNFEEDSSGCSLRPRRTNSFHFAGPLVHNHTVQHFDEADNLGLQRPVEKFWLASNNYGLGTSGCARGMFPDMGRRHGFYSWFLMACYFWDPRLGLM